MSERGGERISPKERKQRILRALGRLGGEATIQEIAAESGISANGISQTLASDSMQEYATRLWSRKSETNKQTQMYGKLTPLGMANFGLVSNPGRRIDEPASAPKDELPPPPDGDEVLL